jgi:hypothetical protein
MVTSLSCRLPNSHTLSRLGILLSSIKLMGPSVLSTDLKLDTNHPAAKDYTTEAKLHKNAKSTPKAFRSKTLPTFCGEGGLSHQTEEVRTSQSIDHTQKRLVLSLCLR